MASASVATSVVGEDKDSQANDMESPMPETNEDNEDENMLTSLMNDMILQKFKALPTEHEATLSGRFNLKEAVENDFKKAFELYPMNWVGQVSDNGKSIALFDKGQQKRNQCCKYE